MVIQTERFVVEELVGSGGFGTVYRAHDRRTGGRVALKVLRKQTAREGGRFTREARVLAHLEHPAIVRYIAHGQTASGEPFLAMEWLDGEDLAAHLRRQGLDLGETLRLGVRVAGALETAHRAGVVHRDIKPSNLFLPGGDIDRVKLLDFGVARSRVVHTISTAGRALGTPAYMAPEQARGDRQVGPPADVFALGCVLFECLVGRAPFSAHGAVTLMAKMLFEAPPDGLRARAGLPPPVVEAVERMLAKEPAQRFADGSDALAELKRLAALPLPALPPPPRPELAEASDSTTVPASLLSLQLTDDEDT
jgi:serine/threonine protein kinase